jgi:hypothetical protein
MEAIMLARSVGGVYTGRVVGVWLAVGCTTWIAVSVRRVELVGAGRAIAY